MPGPSAPPPPGGTNILRVPPKISATGESYGPPAPGSEGAKLQLVTDEVTQTWTTFVTALGQSAPHHVNRIHRATVALRRYGG